MKFNHIVMYSSGIGSWAAAKRVANKYGTENLTLLFANTTIEDADNYRFLNESAANIGGQLVTVADGRDPWSVAIEKKWLNHRNPFCSLLLKIKPCEEYLKSNSNLNSDNTKIYFGIDWEEYSRLEAIAANWSKFSNFIEAPLCWGDTWLDKNACLEWCRQEGISPPSLYEKGFSHANCGGFCFKAGKGQFRNLLKHDRDLYLYHEQKEQEFRQQEGCENITILRESKNGVRTSLTLREFRKRIEAEPLQLDLFDEALGGCGCFIDG